MDTLRCRSSIRLPTIVLVSGCLLFAITSPIRVFTELATSSAARPSLRVSSAVARAAGPAKRRTSQAFDEDPEDFGLPGKDGDFSDEYDADSDEGMMEPPPEVIESWFEDPAVEEILSMFRSEDKPGVSPSYGKDQRVLSYYDVAKLLETIGLDRETFVEMFLLPVEGEEYDDEDFGEMMYGEEEDDEFVEEKPRRKGGKGGRP
mmetsp:Transcript_3499/g.8711  ORF Transcript_3499/g.8711 Transcript_3499/m.8711 type:complete len:204 (+) Transcript_3499:74-685(+)